MVSSNYDIYLSRAENNNGGEEEPKMDKTAFERYYALCEERAGSNPQMNQFSFKIVDCNQDEYGGELEEFFEEDSDKDFNPKVREILNPELDSPKRSFSDPYYDL